MNTADLCLPASRPNDEPQNLVSGLAGTPGIQIVVEAAHDLRSPLTSIMFLAEALQLGHGGPVTDEQRRKLAMIRSAALCLCATATDLMELARVGQLVEQAPTPLSIAAMLAAIRDMTQPVAEEKDLDLRVRVAGPDIRVGHQRALSRALLNLTTNALKYTDRGHVAIDVRPVGPARVRFTVRDTGPGIPADDLPTLFQPFRPNGGTRPHFSSAGLGLAIVRRLVAAMGAELRVATRPGSGTSFWFEVELPPAAAAA